MDKPLLPLLVNITVFVTGAFLFFVVLRVFPSMLRWYRNDFQHLVNRSKNDHLVFIDGQTLFRVQWLFATSLAAIAAWITQSVMVACATAMVAAVLPRYVAGQFRVRRLRHFRAQLPELMGALAGALRAGSGLGLALSRASERVPAPAGLELDLLLRQQRMGCSFSESLSMLERRMPLEETLLFSTALRVGAESGGGLADALDSMADSVRRRLFIEDKLRTLTAQGRLQAWVMSLLPIVILALLSLLDPVSFYELTRTDVGRWVLAAVATGQILGFLMIRRITRLEV